MPNEPEILKEEHKLCLALCSIAEKKIVPTPKKEIVPKKPPPKKKIIQKKPKPKLIKPKPKIEKKVVKKRVEAKKKILVVKEKVIEEKIEVTEKKVPLPVSKPIPVEIVEKSQEALVVQTVVESTQEKNARLEKEYLDENIVKIRELIKDNLYYPRSARKRGVVGDVLVKFTISKNSEVHSITVLSSKSEILSRAAKKTIENLSSEFPTPNEELTLNVPISYRLH